MTNFVAQQDATTLCTSSSKPLFLTHNKHLELKTTASHMQLWQPVPMFNLKHALPPRLLIVEACVQAAIASSCTQ